MTGSSFPAPLVERLREAVGPQHVSTSNLDTGRYPRGRGSSPPPPPGAPPSDVAVVWPGAATEIQKVLRAAAEHGVPVIAVGTGSLGLAHAPLGKGGERGRILLDLKRMTNVLHLDATSLLCHVQAGATLGQLEERLDRDALTVGDMPAESYRSTIGGLLAGRAPGRATSRLGPLESACLGVSAVLADGRLVHDRIAPRKAAGPDLSRLLVGSEGAFGIITAATLRIHRRPEVRHFASWAMGGVDEALGALRAALRQEVRPSIARVYDPELAASTFEPLAPRGKTLVIACCAGAREMAQAERSILEDAFGRAGGVPLGEDAALLFWNRRLEQVRGQRAGDEDAALFPVAAALGRLMPVYQSVKSSLRALGADAAAAFGRFHADGGCVFFELPADPRLEAAAREAAVGAGGRPADEVFADDRARPYLRQLKTILDPTGILNPGRMVD